MKQVLSNLWAQFVAAGAPARWAALAVVAVFAGVSGFQVYQAKNPHFEVLLSGLDDSAFNRAVSALANKGIRYRTTMPPGPYSVFVESAKRYEAQIAVDLDGNLAGPSRGIDAEVGGTAAMFLGSRERDQRSEKRDWQETEKQLETLVWVSRASVKVSGSTSSTLFGRKRDDRRASAVLSLRGGLNPDIVQRRTLATIISNSTGVPLTHVTVTDQNGNMLFSGGDEHSVESQLAIERAWQSELERKLQALLDQSFGPGLTLIGVNGQWKHVRQESVEETLDPSKRPKSKRTLKVEGSSSGTNIGGPAGQFANIAEGQAAATRGGSESGSSSTSESEESYAFGSRTTHMVAQPHVLEWMSLSLVVDDSIKDKLEAAEKAVKGWSGFDAQRGDNFDAVALTLHGLTRDGDGKPVLPEPEAPPEPKSPLLGQLLEHGIEIVAAVAFLILLGRTLKSAQQSAKSSKVVSATTTIDLEAGIATVKLDDNGKPMLGDLLAEEDIDLDMLARKHVEDLLEKEPEKVSALLSRWALGEQFYAANGKK